MKLFGVQTLEILYASKFWDRGADKKELPDKVRFQRVIRNVKTDAYFAILDIEAWPVRGYPLRPWVMKNSIDKYITTLVWAREARPDLKWTMFGRLPLSNYQASISEPGSPQYRYWQKENDRMMRLAGHLEIALPSVYTYDSNPVLWKKSFNAKMNELDRVFPRGKKYVFIWPQYFDHSPAPENIRLKYIPADFWYMQLKCACERADGIVIWGGWDFKRRRPAQWCENAEWWSATKRFLKDIRTK